MLFFCLHEWKKSGNDFLCKQRTANRTRTNHVTQCAFFLFALWSKENKRKRTANKKRESKPKTGIAVYCETENNTAMSYSSGMLKHRVVIQNRTEAKSGKFGVDTSGVEYENVCTVWAAVDWSRGTRAMNAGALDVYGVVIVRCRYNPFINERSRIVYEGKTYQVLGETLHIDRQANTVQFHAQQLIND